MAPSRPREGFGKAVREDESDVEGHALSRPREGYGSKPREGLGSKPREGFGKAVREDEGDDVEGHGIRTKGE